MPAFADCFDATTKWVSAKQAAHKHILASTIEEPDIVLIEAGIKHRFPSERLANGRTNYDSWTVEFELHHLALLAIVPKETVDFNDGSEAYEV